MEERPDAQKQILVEIARKLPIFTRAQSGGKSSDNRGLKSRLHELPFIIYHIKHVGQGY